MPRRRYRAAVLVAVKNKPLRARDPRAFLTATRHVGVYSVRPGRKDGSAGPNKRITRRAKRPLPVLVTNSPQRGGRKRLLDQMAVTGLLLLRLLTCLLQGSRTVKMWQIQT